jgi:23S rRNA (guanosine2251-2'-O)-methyltransferase
LSKSPKDVSAIVGRNPVYEAIVNGKEIEKVYILSDLRGEYEKKIRQITKDKLIPLVKVPAEKLNKLCNHPNHQGIVAMISPVQYQKIEEVIAHTFDQGKNPLIIVLESISDVRNLGAISRSAYVMGVDAIVTTTKNAAQINEDTVKISAGAILNIPICREKNMLEVLRILKESGIKILSTDLKGAVDITHTDLTIPIAIIMGDEHNGVTFETLKASDEKIKIPQASDFDSLNVSVAAGIIMYEVQRQRLNR